MYGFLLILGTIVLGNAFWWWWADRRLRPLPLAVLWRLALALFVGGQLAYLAAFFVAPAWARRSHHVLPPDLLGTFYLWSIVVLPATFLVTLLLTGSGAVARWARRMGRAENPGRDPRGLPAPATTEVNDSEGDPRPHLSRRQVLAAAAVAVPPLLTGAGVAYGRSSLHDLEVRRLDVPIPGLPSDLAGLTIAHITDVHVGKFVGRSYLKQVSDATNAAGADLHLLTGDLIDLSIRDLPDAIEFVRNLQPRLAPPVMCEGNHDLIDDPAEFYRQVTAAGIDLVRTPTAVPNEENDARQAAAVSMFARESGRTLLLPGRRPLRLIGERWSHAGLPAPGALGYDVAVDRLKAARDAGGAGDAGAFPVLLAHHPHAFDAAAGAGIPLTLAGHTHGGLLMLSDRLGPAAWMYRYFRGLYAQGRSSLYVSNGVGSWFPVRVRARPEVAVLRLVPA